MQWYRFLTWFAFLGLLDFKSWVPVGPSCRDQTSRGKVESREPRSTHGWRCLMPTNTVFEIINLLYKPLRDAVLSSVPSNCILFRPQKYFNCEPIFLAQWALFALFSSISHPRQVWFWFVPQHLSFGLCFRTYRDLALSLWERWGGVRDG